MPALFDELVSRPEFRAGEGPERGVYVKMKNVEEVRRMSETIAKEWRGGEEKERRA